MQQQSTGTEGESADQGAGPGAPDARAVFVVHGRDTAARKAMCEFLRTIGLRVIERSEAVAATGKASPYIGEVLDCAFGMARAVVVLVSGDDEAKLREELLSADDPDYEGKLTPQARPNVLFEAGMAFASHPKRTVIVELGELRPFSDIAGRHVLRFKGSSEDRHRLAQWLERAGCEVDLAGTDWLRAGNFSPAGRDEGRELAEVLGSGSGAVRTLSDLDDRRRPDDTRPGDVAPLEMQCNEARAFFDRMVGRYQAGPGFDPNHLYYPED